MEGKARIIFPILATAVIVFVVSAVVTFVNIGFRADFVRRWLTAFIIGWPGRFGRRLFRFAIRAPRHRAHRRVDRGQQRVIVCAQFLQLVVVIAYLTPQGESAAPRGGAAVFAVAEEAECLSSV
jgi:hypothetical protein